MKIVEKIDLAMNDKISVMPEAGRECFKIVKKWIEQDEELKTALELLKAIRDIEVYERNSGGDCVILFDGIADQLNDSDYDEPFGLLTKQLIKAGEIVREVL